MKKLVASIISSLVLATSMMYVFNNGILLNASEKNINTSNCYINCDEKNTINSQIQSFNDSALFNETNMYSIGSSEVNDISFVINNYDLDNSYKIYSSSLIDENAIEFKDYISSNYKIEVPFINENGETNIAMFQSKDNSIEFIGIQFGESTFPNVSQTYNLINSYFSNTTIEDIKFIELSQYDKKCAYVVSNGDEYIIDLTNDENTNIYTFKEFINQLDLSKNYVFEQNLEYYENGENDKIAYLGRPTSNNQLQTNNINTKDNKNTDYIFIISCSVSAVVIIASIILLKKKKN